MSYRAVGAAESPKKGPGLEENPPWTDRILRDNTEEIHESGLPEPANLVGGLVARKGAPRELGAGSYGAVYSTTDPGMVFKVTSDKTEADFIRAALKIGEWPAGIVTYHEVIAFPEKFRKRDTFGIWRESAILVGLQDGMEEAETTYEEIQLQEFNSYLRWFGSNAGFARDTLKRAKDPANMIKEAREWQQWAYDTVGPAEATPPWRWGNTMRFYAEDFKGAQRVAAALRACEIISQNMGSTDKMSYVGKALEFYLDRGILLADVHHDNVGLVEREDFYEPIWVITDPGHAVLLDKYQ
jgi:hypothetical protein